VNEGAPRYSPRYVNLVVAMLACAIFVEFFHRQVLAVVMADVGRDLALTDTQLGSLVMVFAFAYSASAPLLGRLVDRLERRGVYVAGIAIWSAATAASGVAGGFAAMIATRALAGAGQGASGATNSPLIADYVPPARRGGVIALVSMGATLAALAAGAFGSAGVVERFGWRAFFIGSGLFGIAFAALFAAIVREPPRGWSEGRATTPAAAAPLSDVVRLFRERSALVHTFLGTALNSVAVFAIAQWVVVFFERSHGLSNALASRALMAVALACTIGAIVGGVVANRAWTVRPRAVLGIPAFCSALAGPALFLGATTGAVGSAIALYAAAGLLALVHSAPAGAAMQAMIPDRMRGSVSGILASVMTLIGLGGGPFIAGLLSDAFGGASDPASIGRALSCVALLFLWSAAHFALAARSFADDLAETSREANGPAS
jgi:predicted MFS family arabinose efflux permease